MGGLLIGCFSASLAFGQVNPNGWIRTKGWNILVPLTNPYGCRTDGGLTVAQMKLNWVAPHVIQREDPKGNTGDEWPDIDFGGTAAAPGYDVGGLNFDPATGKDTPIWVTNAAVEGFFGLPPGTMPDDDLVRFQDGPSFIDFINANIIPAVPGTHALPVDNIMGLATTYINNKTGAVLAVEICGSSDDALQVWVNNKLVINNPVCRGSSDRCDDQKPVILPPGVSKIAALVWERGGGFNLRLGILVNGERIKDGNDKIEFLGAGAPDTVGQEVYVIDRSIASKALNCPNDVVKVALKGSGPGDGADLLTVVEEIRAGNPAALELTDTSGGVVADILPTPPVATPVGNFPDHRLIGNDGGALPSTTTYDVGTSTYTSTSTTAGDLWDFSNDFEFAYTRLEGDFDISIKYLSRTLSGAVADRRWGKFGLMARQTLDGCSKFYSMMDYLPVPCDRPGVDGCDGPNGDKLEMIGRSAHLTCNTMDFVAGAPDASLYHPTYVRLTRRGNAFEGWASNNGGVEATPADDGLWTKFGSRDWGGAPAKQYVGFFNMEHGSNGENTQEIKFQLLNASGTAVPLFDLDPIGKKITWTDVARSAVTGGSLMYNVRYNQRGAVDISGQAVNVGLIGGDESANFSPQTGPIGAFDNSHDLGTPGTAGSMTFDGTTYTMTASGDDFWDGGDQGHFAYKAVSGDFIATVHISNRIHPAAGGRWGKHGVMARYTCDSNSKHTLAETELATNPAEIELPRHHHRINHLDNGSNRESYLVNDGVFPTEGRLPTWIRLVRRGNGMYSYMSEDDNGKPKKWTDVGFDNDPNRPQSLLVGVALTSHAGATTATISFDNFSIVPLDNDCVDFTPLLVETSSGVRTDGLGTLPYTALLVTARVAADTADAVAHGGGGLAVKNRNWFWKDLTVGAENLEGTIQVLWNNENRNFNPDGAGNPAVTPLLRFAFSQKSRAYMAWDRRHVKGGGDNPAGTVNNGWFDFNNAVGTLNAQGWLRVGDSSAVNPAADIIWAEGDGDHARGGLWLKDFKPGEVLETFQTGYSGGRSPYSVFIRCGQACSKGETLTTLEFNGPEDLGIVVAGGTTPAHTGGTVANGRLMITNEGPGNQRISVWYGVPADIGAGGRPLLAEGFVAEWDAYMTHSGQGNPPADGMTFAVVATGANDGLASAFAPFPPGLGVTSLRGSGGGSLGYSSFDNNFSMRGRVEGHPSFAIEMDNWVGGDGGSDPANEPGDGGSPGNPRTWHIGVDVQANVSSVQTNAQFGVPSPALPDIFSPQGAHIEVQYRPDGAINVWVSGVDKNGQEVPRMQVLSTVIPPLAAGDVLMGFTGGTGGATSTQEVDNVKLSAICCEQADSAAITGPTSGTKGEGSVKLTGLAGGVEVGAAATYAWSLVSGTAVLTDNGDGTASVESDSEGDVVVRLATGDGACTDGATDEHTITFSCPSAGDTHCAGLTVQGGPGPGNYVATANATDDSGDSALSYLFSASDGVNPPIAIGPQPSNVANLNLGLGVWTVSVTVDDDPGCSDAAADATCTQPLTVCPLAGDTHCTGLTVSGPGTPGTYTATATAVDDSGDTALSYTFKADDGAGHVITVGPQPSNTASLDLGEGNWTVMVTIDDDPNCPDAAANASCSAPVSVTVGGRRKPGDSDRNGKINSGDAISDAFHLLSGLFKGEGTPPCGGEFKDINTDLHPVDRANRLILDWVGEGEVTITSAIAHLRYSFLGGPAHVLGVACRPFIDCEGDACEAE